VGEINTSQDFGNQPDGLQGFKPFPFSENPMILNKTILILERLATIEHDQP